MATLNPRITITLTPAVAAVLRELSQLAGNSQSAIVGELLETSRPVFERVVSALRAASTIQESAKSEIAAGLERAQAKIEDQLGLLLGEVDDGIRPLLQEAEKINRRGAGAQITPVPVTRGSGQPHGGPKGSGKVYSALNPITGERELLPVGQHFDKHGVVKKTRNAPSGRV